ncbi:hypothetical protein TBLA_0A07020 [Henningerozyma blattae CBS 6284]|uniref:Phosphoinositide phospholipase C n=1 Tax=Henningerozyma blattae (strain ATCC 34711 / CBS 6284 / DSM 70876 / NBRC 10599 / NRRL Y-10934 / UCD 77-7) TaxID=1071380 RepID=I2GWJ1_HENB6|nr:hypothetical protein TBLA_0A07020 [Tetrapisispora blattae CBS 6284]CCH58493.1 hypothetical protein TBLA_0A07020 [Tetrapisispora blattae CBS 6284]
MKFYNVELPCIKLLEKRKMLFFKLINNKTIIWKNGSKRLDIDSIKDVRTDSLARNYIEEYGIDNTTAKWWVTLIYVINNNKLKCLHLVLNNEEEFKLFVSSILDIIKERRELMQSILVPDHARFANIHWESTVSPKKEDEIKETLTFQDVQALCSKFNIVSSHSYLHKNFLLADVNNNGLLNFAEFQTFVKLLKKRDEIDTLWKNITLNKNKMNFESFFDFISTKQGENITKKAALRLFKQISQFKETINKDIFLKYLRNEPYTKNINENYSHPITDYFIASSHNTYLLGKQVAETPSVEGYIQVLQQGCRSVEIDIWDSEIGPVVCHGLLTSAIPLSNVVTAIRKYAFITSPYPLIISLEINCGPDNQLLTVKILREILGNSLLESIVDKHGIMSPRHLKHKIILKSKKCKHVEQQTPLSSFSSYSSSHESEVEIRQRRKKSTASIERFRRIKLKHDFRVIDQLLEISAIHGIRFRNTSLPESKTVNHCFSLNEKKIDKLCQDKTLKLAIDKHNRKFFMRVFPHVIRYKSSNFNPIQFWKYGTQMVATNWQTYDIGQQLNIAMFQLTDQKNGILNSGYVLKPKYIREKTTNTKNIPLIYEKIHQNKKKLIFNILSAQFLPSNDLKKGCTIAPYVIIEFFTTEITELNQDLQVHNGTKISDYKITTKTCPGNGFNPVWNCEMSINICDDSFTFIRLCVKSSDTTLGVICFKLDYLKRGYRHVPLYNMEGERYVFSTVFLYSEIK